MTIARTSAKAHPFGATVVDGGVNFSLFSRTATGVELLFFDREDDAHPSRVIRIDPATNRTYHYWHVFVPGVLPGQIYGYRVEGPSAPERGLRFDSTKVLLDPYGRGVVVPKNYTREAARQPGDNAATAMKSVVVDPGSYDWEGDRPAAPAFRAHDHLRDARPRLHAPSEFRASAEDARHLRRPDREDSLSPATRHHRRGTAAGVSVRRPGLSAGQGQLLGLRPDLVLCAAPGVQLASGSARPGRRISRHGQGPAPRGHRSHSRRGVQPHGRRRRARADALLPRHRQPDLLHPRRRRRAVRQLHRLRQHAQCQSSRSCGG